MKRNSGFIGSRQSTNASVAKGIHDLYDVHIKRIVTQWPRTELYVSITPSVTTVVEGNSMTFTIVTEHIANDTTLYYTISTVSGTTMVDADFSATPNDGGIDGSFTTTNDSTVLTFGLVAEVPGFAAENNVFKLQIRTGSTSGTVVIESSNITVTDAVGAYTNLESAFYEISNRAIVITSNDYTGAYDVGEVQQNSSGSFRIFLALKCTTATTYYNDICIAAVQVLNSSDVLQQTWNFAGGNAGWSTVTADINPNNSNLFSTYLTPTQAASYSYPSTIGTGGNVNYLTRASSTGSNYTGMADGIANSTTTVYSVGNGTVAQSSGTSYVYREVSGAARYSHVVGRSPDYTFSQGDKIRVVHAVTIPSNQSSSINIDDSIWIGIH